MSGAWRSRVRVSRSRKSRWSRRQEAGGAGGGGGRRRREGLEEEGEGAPTGPRLVLTKRLHHWGSEIQIHSNQQVAAFFYVWGGGHVGRQQESYLSSKMQISRNQVGLEPCRRGRVWLPFLPQ